MKTLLLLILLNFHHSSEGVTIDVDTSGAPDLLNFGGRVKATLEDWYPYMSRLLYSPTFQKVSRIPITFDPNYKGVAYASGGRIVGSVDYYRSHQDDVGSMIHEMVHVIQHYRNCPVWVAEGIADWARYYHYEPHRKPGKPGIENKHTQGYGVSAYFLDWINQRYFPMIYWINKGCREGTYKDTIFPRLTKKTVNQHWKEMVRSRA